MKDIISKITAGLILFLFFITAGILISPFWLVVTVIGALLQAFKWEDAPKIWWDLVTIKWILRTLP